jgi:hypothetical protein
LISWRQKEHPDGLQGVEASADFWARRAEWWGRCFRLERLQGIKVPGMPVLEGKRQRDTPRQFGFFMMTDGVGCSFVCHRARRGAAPSPYTPETVPYDPDTTVFKAIDPGMSDIVVGITPELFWGSVGEDGMDVDGRGR